MKYILLMSGTSAGVEGYHAWSKPDIEAHMAVLQRINKDLSASGEFVATQGLADPREAKFVRGEKSGMPVTDGVFPESKEFLLGYWIVDVDARCAEEVGAEHHVVAVASQIVEHDVIRVGKGSVANAQRAYAIAGQISAAPGPGGKPTNMPIEVRQFATHTPQTE